MMLGAVYVIEACPEELVVLLGDERLPELVDQVIVFPVNGEPPEVSVAVRVVEPPELRVKLDGEIESAVVDFSGISSGASAW